MSRFRIASLALGGVGFLLFLPVTVGDDVPKALEGWRDWLNSAGAVLPQALLALALGLIVVGAVGPRLLSLMGRPTSPSPPPDPALSFLAPRVQSHVPMIDGSSQLFVFGRVRNDRASSGTGATARRAHLTMTYHSIRDEEVIAGPFPGRWRDAPSPLEQSPLRLHTDSYALDLAANGAVYEFDIATRREDSGQIFGIDATQSTHAILSKEVLVTVEIRGENFDPLTDSYRLSNSPGGVSIEHVPSSSSAHSGQ